MWKEITEKERVEFDKVACHPLQTYEWGEFREKTGLKVVRMGYFEKDKLVRTFQMTIHPLPHMRFTIGYFPKGELPDELLTQQLQKMGAKYQCIFIQVEPNHLWAQADKEKLYQLGYKTSQHPLFPEHTLILDLQSSDEELLAKMHPKTRYNIKVAQRHGVSIEEDNSEKALDIFWQLMEETTRRQGFSAHSHRYFRLMWQTFSHDEKDPGVFHSHEFLAKYQEKVLAAWIVFTFKDMLYYPYGASSREDKEVMAPNLIMWEVIQLGKKLGLKTFDMWGALGPDADESDPWFGFHQFKLRYGAHIQTFIGSYDLIISPFQYSLYTFLDKFRYALLRKAQN